MNPRVAFWFGVSFVLAVVVAVAFYAAFVCTTVLGRFGWGFVMIVMAGFSYITSQMAKENRSWLR
jgi:hypothetical protein